jgi:DHA1 family bicyclomycin/chloramphenicol resistance-like MFS transporter
MPPSRLHMALILGALVAFAPLSIDMYLPAFPALAREFAASHAAVQLTLAAYLAGIAAGQLLWGPLSDSFGRKRPLYAGTALFAAGSIACALAGSIDALTGFRLLQALGGCAGMVIARAIVRDRHEGTEAARFYSLLMLVIGIAPILGPLAGSQMLAVSGWRAIFWLIAGFGLACLIAVVFLLPETLPRAARRNGGAAGALDSYRVLLGDRRFLAYAAGNGLAMAGMFAYIAGSPFVFTELHGLTPGAFAILFGLNAFAFIGASQINRALLTRIDTVRLVRLASAVQVAAGLVLLVCATTGAFGIAGLAVPLFVTIGSLGFIAPNATALAMQPHPEIAGAASALAGTLQFGFGALNGALIGALPSGTSIPLALACMGASLFGAACLFSGGPMPRASRRR